MRNRHLLMALIKKLEGEVAVCESNVRVYLDNPAGIGEHPHIVEAIELEVTKLTEALDKIETIKKRLQPDEL